MSAPNDGGPAFPSEHSEQQDGSWNLTLERGMTLSYYFAAKALGKVIEMVDDRTEDVPDDYPGVVAAICYRFADAMLAEREKSYD